MSPPYNANTTASELVTDYASVIQDKTILITGVSPGSLGAFYAHAVAKATPANLIIAGRNLTKLEQCAKDIALESPKVKIRTLQIDLGSFQNIREAAAQVNGWDDIPAIDVLVNNAGIMGVPYAVTVDGFESQFATNHLGPFLFTNLIMSKVLKSESPRIVMVSSDGHRLSPVRLDDYNFDVSFFFPCSLPYFQLKSNSDSLKGWQNIPQMVLLRPIQDSQHVNGPVPGRKTGSEKGPTRIQPASGCDIHKPFQPSGLAKWGHGRAM